MLARSTPRVARASAPAAQRCVRVNAFKPVSTQGLVAATAACSLLLVSVLMLELLGRRECLLRLSRVASVFELLRLLLRRMIGQEKALIWNPPSSAATDWGS